MEIDILGALLEKKGASVAEALAVSESSRRRTRAWGSRVARAPLGSAKGRRRSRDEPSICPLVRSAPPSELRRPIIERWWRRLPLAIPFDLVPDVDPSPGSRPGLPGPA
jgi:hypothetical protein